MKSSYQLIPLPRLPYPIAAPSSFLMVEPCAILVEALEGGISGQVKMALWLHLSGVVCTCILDLGQRPMSEKGLPSHDCENITLVDGFPTSMLCICSQIVTDLLKEPVRGLHNSVQGLLIDFRLTVSGSSSESRC